MLPTAKPHLAGPRGGKSFYGPLETHLSLFYFIQLIFKLLPLYVHLTQWRKSANSFESPGSVLHLLGQWCSLGLTPRDQIARINKSNNQSSSKSNFTRPPGDDHSVCGWANRGILMQKDILYPDTLCDRLFTSSNQGTYCKYFEVKLCLWLCFGYSRILLLWWWSCINRQVPGGWRPAAQCDAGWSQPAPVTQGGQWSPPRASLQCRTDPERLLPAVCLSCSAEVSHFCFACCKRSCTMKTPSHPQMSLL